MGSLPETFNSIQTQGLLVLRSKKCYEMLKLLGYDYSYY